MPAWVEPPNWLRMWAEQYGLPVRRRCARYFVPPWTGPLRDLAQARWWTPQMTERAADALSCADDPEALLEALRAAEALGGLAAVTALLPPA